MLACAGSTATTSNNPRLARKSLLARNPGSLQQALRDNLAHYSAIWKSGAPTTLEVSIWQANHAQIWPPWARPGSKTCKWRGTEVDGRAVVARDVLHTR